MGITTQYLRYEPGSVFGIIGTGKCVRFVTKYNQTSKYVAAPACSDVIIWDTRRGVKILTLDADVTGEVTVIEPRPPAHGSLDTSHIAVGYSDGTVTIFDLTVGQPLKFAGHRGSVSSLAWDPQGMRIASASEDGELVIWDVVSERGMVHLKGHKGKVTRLHFLRSRNIVVSSCRDSFIKFWDLDTNHCFRTLTGHRAEVWDFVLLKNDTRLVSGSSDSELRVWSLKFLNDEHHDKDSKEIKKDPEEPPTKLICNDTDQKLSERKEINNIYDEEKEDNDASILEIKKLGSIIRSRGDRVCGLHSDGNFVICHGKSPVLDIFAVLNDEEVMAKVAKRLKKARKRARDNGSEFNDSEEPQLGDEIRKLPTIRACTKISSIDVHSDRTGIVKMGVLLVDNRIAIYGSSLDAKEEKQSDKNLKDVKESQVSILERPGHRTEIRVVAFNSIGDQLITASAESLKVWHRADTQSISTMTCDYAVSLLVVPGDRHALIGTRSGRLQLFDLGSAMLLEDILAHEAEEGSEDTGVWSVALTHDGRGFVSGGSDKMVKFWKFELVQDTTLGLGKRLSFLQDSRALKVADQVTCVKCSNNGKFIAVATLDLKETLYFTDSLKLCHELYGKSMPATCLDFASDCTIIATGSKDTCIRLYGTDFGDQRRLLKNAHRGGVTALQFLPNTHLLFSAGHDGSVKQWDADRFQRIITLEGHIGIVRCLAVCPKGAWVVSCGQDRSVRLWEKTKEPLILEEEREEERRKEEESDIVLQRPVVLGEDGAQAVRPSVTTHLTEKAADMILEALVIFREQIQAGSRAIPNELMTFVYHTSDPWKFVLEVLRKVKSSELEEAILVLPLDRILELLVVLKGLLERDWDCELTGRILVLAVRINLPQLLASTTAAPIILALSDLLLQHTKKLQDMVGFNLAGLRHLKDRVEQRTETQLFAEASQKVKDARKRKKKKDRAIKRVLLSI